MSVFKHCYFNKVFAKVTGGVGINHLSASRFARLPIPLAPDLEQAEIANEVARQLSFLKKTAEVIETNLVRVARTRQSILQQAFAGELVPQNPGDEPVEELLARIRNEKKARSKKTTQSDNQETKRMITIRRSLLDVLRAHPEGLSPETLLTESGRTLEDIEDFYRELRLISDNIEELRPDGDATKRWPAEAQITLRLRST